MKYRIVQCVDGHLLASDCTDIVAAMKARNSEQIGVNRNPNNRSELQGQPKFDKFLGPMYGGPGIIRYEDSETYRMLSV